MIKIGLRHPSGLEIEFEGDKDDFQSFTKFLTDSLGQIAHALSPAGEPNRTGLQLPTGQDNVGIDGNDDTEVDVTTPMGSGGEIDARAVSARIAHLQAATDIDRVTIMSQAAIDAGNEGIDYITIERLYGDLGIPKPARFAKAFSNAKQRGLVKSVKFGVWAPTVQGENYALYGRKPSGRRSATKRPSDNQSTAPQLERGDALPDE